METTAPSIVRIIESIDPREFDARALHPMQSYEWGEARMKTGIRVIRFGEYADGKLSAVYQMTLHKIPGTKKCVGYVARSGIPNASVISFLQKWGRDAGVAFIKWEPYVREEESAQGFSASPSIVPSREPLFTEWNLEVDLAPAPQEIFDHFHKNTRYAIRQAEKAGVEAREMSTDEGFEIFSDLYFETARRQNYHGHTKAYHKILWDALARAGIAHIFVAFYKGRPQAAFEIFFFGGRAYYPYSGSSATDRSVPATQYLMWQVIQAAKAEGCTVLDLWGSLAPEHAKDHPFRGFTLFKRGFGSSFVHMSPSYDQVISPAWYRIYRMAYKARKLSWKGRKVSPA